MPIFTPWKEKIEKILPKFIKKCVLFNNYLKLSVNCISSFY
jgi:hypothetical protein